MAYTAQRATINQKVQVGAESLSALGTSVSAGKLLECFDFTFGPSTDISSYAPTGHKYTTITELNEEWVDGTMGGNGDYNGLIYPLSGAMGNVTPASHLTSATAKDWVFSPPTTGTTEPQTYTFEQGDSTRAHKFSYGLFTQFGYKFDRKTFTVSGKVLGQQLSDGITMTASPTAVALAPIVPSQVNVYLDSTQAGLGTTQLTKLISGDYTMDTIYGPTWFVNRANASYSTHVDMKPTCTFKFMIEADTAGMAPLATMRAGSTVYVRVEAIGGVIDGTTSTNNSFVHDMALRITKVDPFADSAGIFAVGYECVIIEDPIWNKAQTITLTNLITAL